MADIEKMKAELERLQEKEAVFKARRERQMARINTEKRKQRNKRLIEKGAVLEDIQAQAKGLRKVPKVARVAKADDPQGYANYQAYKTYNQEKEQLSEQISPADSKEWLGKLVDRSAMLDELINFTKGIHYQDGESVFDKFVDRNNQRS